MAGLAEESKMRDAAQTAQLLLFLSSPRQGEGLLERGVKGSFTLPLENFWQGVQFYGWRSLLIFEALFV